MATSTVLKKLSMATAGAAFITLGGAYLNTLTPLAQASTITNGFTFSVANSGSSTPGSHFHSSTGGSFGNPAGKAEVGNFSSEEVRGLSEYNLAGLNTVSSAFVTFNVFKAGGLFVGSNDFPFTGNIDVVAYQGNNAENTSDFQASALSTVGTFNTAALPVANTLSFDITSIFNTAISGGSSSLGIRLQTAFGTITNGGAWTFDNFRLSTTNDSTSTQPVPEPASALALLAFGATSILKRKQQQKG